jgi:hypothetical protein
MDRGEGRPEKRGRYRRKTLGILVEFLPLAALAAALMVLMYDLFSPFALAGWDAWRWSRRRRAAPAVAPAARPAPAPAILTQARAA